jgi:hypothetical protein
VLFFDEDNRYYDHSVSPCHLLRRPIRYSVIAMDRREGCDGEILGVLGVYYSYDASCICHVGGDYEVGMRQ